MHVGIVGLGYVGLPLAVAFCDAGHTVIGVDVDPRKIGALKAGESYIEDVPDETLRAVSERLSPTLRFAELSRCDAVIVAVPTPLTKNREPDLSALLGATRAITAVLQRGQLIVVESTTYPGTTREQVVPLLEESGLKAGTEFSVAFSPERIDPGRTDYVMRNTPKVVGGLTAACQDRAVALYGEVCDHVVPVSTPEVAELTKLLENVFRSVNIALVNELAMLCDRMEIDIWEVVNAASTKPYGFMRFEPGPGMGGHCLPVDPFYLSWRAREFGSPTDFIELAGEVNQAMPRFCAEKVARALNDHAKPVRGSRIGLLGVSYKAGVGDMRESPALKIIQLLGEGGGEVVYHDDYVPELEEFGLSSEPLAEMLDSCDVAVIVTAHPDLDVELVLERAPLVVDFRGVTPGSGVPNLVRL
jgi:UDP-N-acetyl-D-glucosamine dehydrogenase